MGAKRLNSRRKGANGERMWAKVLCLAGYPAERTAQRSGKGGGPMDVESPLCPVPHWEVKLEEKLNLPAAMERAREDANGRMWALAWKQKYKKWIVAMDLDMFLKLIEPLSAKGDTNGTV